MTPPSWNPTQNNEPRRASESALTIVGAARAVEEREEELVAGYGEFFYAGIVCVTAPTLPDLEAATEEVSQVAASVGLEVRPLHGRHDQAVAATLPIARGLAPKGVR